MRSHNPLNIALYRPDAYFKSVDDTPCIVQGYVLLKVSESGFDNDVSIRLTSIETRMALSRVHTSAKAPDTAKL